MKLSKAAERLEFYLSLEDFLSSGPPTVSKVKNQGMPGLGSAKEITRAAEELGLRVEPRGCSRGVSLRIVGKVGRMDEKAWSC